MNYIDLERRYVSLFGKEPTPAGNLAAVEQELSVRLPEDFQEISRFYSGGVLGSVPQNAVAAHGPASNVVEETLRLRRTAGLPHSFVVLADLATSLVLLDTKRDVDRPAVVWADVGGAEDLAEGISGREARTWLSYRDFFESLLADEEEERQSGNQSH